MIPRGHASTTLERSGATEVCPASAGGTVHVVVHAYTDTRYAIRAASATVSSSGSVPDAPPGSPRSPAAVRSDDPAPVTAASFAGGGGAAWLPFLLAATGWRRRRPHRE